MFVVCDKCICITTDCVYPIQSLDINQKKCDTRMLLNVNHINPSIPNVVIYTPNTDVFVVQLAASTELSTNLFIRTGSKGQAQVISV